MERGLSEAITNWWKIGEGVRIACVCPVLDTKETGFIDVNRESSFRFYHKFIFTTLNSPNKCRTASIQDLFIWLSPWPNYIKERALCSTRMSHFPPWIHPLCLCKLSPSGIPLTWIYNPAEKKSRELRISYKAESWLPAFSVKEKQMTILSLSPKTIC